MNANTFRDHCLSKKGVTESFPFDNKTLVFKVMDKMFALTHIDTFESVTLKCEPVRAQQLRDQYEEVKPGYHMNKHHWNTIDTCGKIGGQLFTELIDHSYELVVSRLTIRAKDTLNSL